MKGTGMKKLNSSVLCNGYGSDWPLKDGSNYANMRQKISELVQFNTFAEWLMIEYSGMTVGFLV